MDTEGRTMARKANVIITGSAKGSRSAWIVSRALLRLYGVHAEFVHPYHWDRNIQMDGLLITGGIDVDPLTFSTKKHPSIEKTDPLRDAMELFYLKQAQKKKIPIVGICRGMQMINLLMGGTLYPHILEMDLAFEHPRSLLPTNTLTINPKSHLHKILKTDTLKVNALHHQTVDNLGKELRVSAKDTNDLVQAIESTEENFILGLQWHPEFMPYHWSTHRIFSTFCKEVKKFK